MISSRRASYWLLAIGIAAALCSLSAQAQKHEVGHTPGLAAEQPKQAVLIGMLLPAIQKVREEPRPACKPTPTDARGSGFSGCGTGLVAPAKR